MLFEKLQSICRAMPQRSAVVAGGRRLTYADLDRQATRVARFLLAEAGVCPGAVVAIYGPRTVDTLVRMLGVMKSGAAYTVVEDDGRHAEHQHRLQAIAPALLLCESAQLASLRALGLNAVDAAQAQRCTADIPLPPLTPAHVAYVLFTSGSTGTPKGVAVTHGNIAHYAAAIADRLGIGQGLRYAHVGTLAADLGNTSVLLSLVTGGCLHLLDGELRKDPAALRDHLIRHEIQFLKITPSHWNAIFSSMTAQHHARSNLSHLVLGGEVLPVSLARLILQSGVTRMLVNHYGPTETTVGVTAFALLNTDQLQPIASRFGTDRLALGRYRAACAARRRLVRTPRRHRRALYRRPFGFGRLCGRCGRHAEKLCRAGQRRPLLQKRRPGLDRRQRPRALSRAGRPSGQGQRLPG